MTTGAALQQKRIVNSYLCFIGLAAMSLALLTQMSVAAGPTTADDTQLTEITVTALRRSESLQRVPASITAISGSNLQDQHIIKEEDLVTIVPNLQQAAGVGEGDVNFSLRGISLLFEAPNQQSPIAMYYDGVYVGALALQGVDMFDLERVEVLAGPQGTLYGKNASGGAINLISKVPTQETEGYVTVGAGNFDRREASGAFQMGISDTVAARIAFTYAQAEGWFKNTYPGQPDASSTRFYGVRGTLAWTPSDALKVTLRAQTSLSDPTQYGIYAVGRTPAQVPGTCFGFGSGVGCGFYAPSYFRSGLSTFQFDSNYEPNYDHSAHGASLTADWKITNALALTSISSYNNGSVIAPQDFDGSPLRVFEIPATNAEMNQAAEELRLTSSYGGPFNFIAGAYYNRETSNHVLVTYQYYADGGNTCNLIAFYGCEANSSFNEIEETEAAYTDMTYKLAPSITLHGGLRFTHDEGEAQNYTGGYYNIEPMTPVVIGIDHLGSSYDTNKLTGRAGVDYQVTPDQMLYASYSTSFRGATFNVAAVDSPAEIQPAPPEDVRSVEVGFKTDWFNRKVTFNGAVFDYSYKNQQAFQNFNNLLTLYSIPKSRLFGGELSLNARPVQRLRINGALGYIDTRIQEGTLAGINIAGNRLPLASSFTGNVGLEGDVVQGQAGSVTLGVDGYYVSKVYFDLYNTNRIAQGGYPLLSAHLKYRSADDRFEVALWGRNLANRAYFTSAFDNTASFGFDSFTLGPPRMYGATFGIKF
jgi:iron complex outermembrane recepter protein